MGPRSPARRGGWPAGLILREVAGCVVAKSEILNALRRRSLELGENAEDANRAKKRRSRQTRAPDKPDLSDVAFQGLRDLVLRHSADDLLDYLTILEHEQRRNTANIESAR